MIAGMSIVIAPGCGEGLEGLFGVHPRITVTSPAGGEELAVGETHEITWSADEISGSVEIRYSIDGGVEFPGLVATVPASDGAHTWPIPTLNSTTCRVRVKQLGGFGIAGTSGADFSIAPPSIAVTAPNGGETWYCTGPGQLITWTSYGVQGSIDIHYSTTGGEPWTSVVEDVENIGSYEWTIPDEDSTTCRVRVQETGGSGLSDVSDENFTISPPTITVTSPNGGETWYYQGPDQDITWTSVCVAGNVDVNYTTNGGDTWTRIATDIANSGAYTDWTIPDRNSTQCRVRVQETSGGISDDSDADFTIASATVAVTSPNGGESWPVGSTHDITWTAAELEEIRIELSRDGGATWEDVVASALADPGSFSWDVTGPGSGDCLVRIGDAADGEPSDVSDSAFSIPEITVTSPNGGETWFAGESRSVTWTSAAVSGNVDIHWSANGWENWNEERAGYANVGSYLWAIPSVTSTQCRVRVQESGDNGAEDGSDNGFTIIDASPPVVAGVASAVGADTDANYEAGPLVTITATEQELEADLTGTVSIAHADSGGVYCRPILLTPATQLADVQVRIEIDNTSFDYSHVNADGSDIRFYDSALTELAYWIEEWNASGDSVVWVKVPVAGTAHLLMWYGNTAAVPRSNGELVFEFFDDFEDGAVDATKWDILGSGVIETAATDGYVYTQTNGENWKGLRSKVSFPDGFVLCVKMRLDGDLGANGTMFVGFYDAVSPDPAGGAMAALPTSTKHAGFGEGNYYTGWEIGAEQSDGANREGESVFWFGGSAVFERLEVTRTPSESRFALDYGAGEYRGTLGTFTPAGSMDVLVAIEDRSSSWGDVKMWVYLAFVRKHLAADTIAMVRQETTTDGGGLTDNGDGTYSFGWNTAGFPPGTYAINTTLRDDSGNEDADGAPPDPDLTVTLVDTTAPVVAFVDSAVGTDTDESYECGSVVGILVEEQNRERDLLCEAVINGPNSYTANVVLADPDVDGVYAGAWDTQGSEPGSYAVTATLTDATGNADTDSALVVALLPVAPTIRSTAPTVAGVGKLYSYTVAATGAPIPSISVSGLPVWLTFNGTATISGTPSPGDLGETTDITVTATNSEGADLQVFQITVSDIDPSLLGWWKFDETSPKTSASACVTMTRQH